VSVTDDERFPLLVTKRRFGDFTLATRFKIVRAWRSRWPIAFARTMQLLLHPCQRVRRDIHLFKVA
jgi:hypothetical protein